MTTDGDVHLEIVYCQGRNLTSAISTVCTARHITGSAATKRTRSEQRREKYVTNMAFKLRVQNSNMTPHSVIR